MASADFQSGQSTGPKKDPISEVSKCAAKLASFDYSHVWASTAPAILFLYLEFSCQTSTRLSGIQVLVFMPGSADCDLVNIKNMRYSINTALINHLFDALYPTQTQTVGGTLCNGHADSKFEQWWHHQGFSVLLACQKHCTDAVYQLQTATHQCSNCNGTTRPPPTCLHLPAVHTTSTPIVLRQRTKSSEHCTSATATYHPHLDLNCCTLTSTRLNWCSLHFTFGLLGKKHQQPRVSQAKTIALMLSISCKQQHTSAATVTRILNLCNSYLPPTPRPKLLHSHQHQGCWLHVTFGLLGKKHQQPRVSQAKAMTLTLSISCKQ
eukprot:g75405.t1